MLCPIELRVQKSSSPLAAAANLTVWNQQDTEFSSEFKLKLQDSERPL